MSKYEAEIIKPFGPRILKLILPKEILGKLIDITDKLLLKKLQREGGNIRKSKLFKKKIFPSMGKKEWDKYKK